MVEFHRTCPQCAFRNPPQMRFCGQCGKALPDSTSQLVFQNNALESDLSSEVLERFAQSALDSKGHQREVCVLSVGLVDYFPLVEQLENERLYELIEAFNQTLSKTITQYEGMVGRMTEDGLIALFGAPQAVENSAERALRAAIDLMMAVYQLSQQMQDYLERELQVRIGIHLGRVILGSLHSQPRFDYPVLNHTIKLAQQLGNTAGPGEILATESVYSRTQPLFEFVPIPSLLTDGEKQSKQIYRVLSLKTRPGSVRGLEGLSAPLVGREVEIDLLTSVVECLFAEKRGSLVLITGEAGVGKSRLAAELKQAVQKHEYCQIFEGNCKDYQRSIAYGVFQNLLIHALDLPENANRETVCQCLRQRIQNLFGNETGEVLPYLEIMLSFEPTDPEMLDHIRYLDTSQLSQFVFLAVKKWLIAEARKFPLLIILDDLHWADESSMALFRYLTDLPLQAPVVLQALTRPMIDPAFESIQKRAETRLGKNFLSLQLQTLPAEHIDQLIDSLLASPALPAALRSKIIEHAAGLPFYLEEILRMLIEKRVIYLHKKQWRADSSSSAEQLQIPDTVRELILARFDRLNPLERRLLQIAALIGHEFSFDVLATVFNQYDRDTIEKMLHVFVQHGLLKVQNTRTGRYRFQHDLLQEAIQSTLLKKDRTNLHRCIAEAVEKQNGFDAECFSECLSYHYLQADQEEKALPYLIMAGKNSAASHATAQARQYFEKALELLPKFPHSLQVELDTRIGLGDLLVRMGEYSDARKHYEAALTATRGILLDESVSRSALLHHKIAITFDRQGDHSKALSFLTKSRKIVLALGDSDRVELAEILNDMGWIYFQQGNIEQAEALLTQAHELITTCIHFPILASILNRLGGVYYQKGQMDQATLFVARSIEIREKTGDIIGVARSYSNLGVLYWNAGRLDEALEKFNHSYQLHEKLSDIEGIIALRTNIASILLDMGRIEESKKHLNDSLEDGLRIGHSYLILQVYLHLSRLYILTEDWHSALDISMRSLEHLKGLGDIQGLTSELYVNIATAWLGCGNLDLAHKWVQDAVCITKDHKAHGEIEVYGRALRLLGQIAQAQQQFEEAQRLLQESLEIFSKQVANPIEEGRGLVLLALLYRQRGEMNQAKDLFQRAQMLFEQSQAQLDLSKLQSLQ